MPSVGGPSLTVIATSGNVDATSQAIDIGPQTTRTYYHDSERAFFRDDTHRQTAGVRLPKRGNSGAKGGRKEIEREQIGTCLSNVQICLVFQ